MRPSTFYADNTQHKPLLRGVSHQYGFFISLGMCAYLLSVTPVEKLIPIIAYCIGFSGMLASSSSFHRIQWTVESEVWIRRLDYVMISVMIAGCFTPFCVLSLNSAYSSFVLWTLWTGVAFCIFLNLIWVNSPKVFRTSVYMVLGWIGFPLVPELIQNCGWTCMLMLGTGGLLHTIGGVIYARQSPDPIPEIFGYHEIFHLCVLTAAFMHYFAILIYLV